MRRLKEFEALRGVSIVLLLFLHANIFGMVLFGKIDLAPVSHFVGAFLLGSFFFLAGYFFDLSAQKNINKPASFIFSRALRLFPPYWLALTLFAVFYNLKRFDHIVYFLNLQIIFSPIFVKPLLTLWYISLLFVFYILFGLLVFKVRSEKYLFIYSVLFFILTYIVHMLTGLLDVRFFVYFFVFLAGIYFYRQASVREHLINLAWGYKLFLAILGAGAYQWVLQAGLPWENGLYILAANFFIFSWVLLWLSIFRTSLGNWSMWGYLSTASYFAYLFHRPIWNYLMRYVDTAPWGGTTYFLAFPASLLVLVLSYLMQIAYDHILIKLHLR